jgi:hypothetical protein
MTLLVANNNNDNFVVSVVYISTIRVKRQKSNWSFHKEINYEDKSLFLQGTRPRKPI